jgi:hypothetical protein
MAMRMAFVGLIAVSVFCAGVAPFCKAQTAAPAVDAASQENKSVDPSLPTGQENNPQSGSSVLAEPAYDYSTIPVYSSASPTIKYNCGHFPAI